MEPVIPVYQQNLLYFGSEQPDIGGEILGSCEEAKISQETTIPSLHGIDCFRTRRRSLRMQSSLCRENKLGHSFISAIRQETMTDQGRLLLRPSSLAD